MCNCKVQSNRVIISTKNTLSSAFSHVHSKIQRYPIFCNDLFMALSNYLCFPYDPPDTTPTTKSMPGTFHGEIQNPHEMLTLLNIRLPLSGAMPLHGRGEPIMIPVRRPPALNVSRGWITVAASPRPSAY